MSLMPYVGHRWQRHNIPKQAQASQGVSQVDRGSGCRQHLMHHQNSWDRISGPNGSQETREYPEHSVCPAICTKETFGKRAEQK